MRSCLKQNKITNKKLDVCPSGELDPAVNGGWLIYSVPEIS